MWESSDISDPGAEGLFSGVTLTFGADHDPRVKTTAQRLLPTRTFLMSSFRFRFD